MKALYRGRIATITESMGNPSGPTEAAEVRRRLPFLADRTDEEVAAWAGFWDMDGAVLDGDMWASYADPDLVVDPTDAQVEASRRGDPIPADPEILRDCPQLALALRRRS